MTSRRKREIPRTGTGGLHPPLAVDVDGTLTRPDTSVDPRVVDALRPYVEAAPVVVATGKAFPYSVAPCEFVGFP